MIDCVGNELEVGDKVICSDMNYADLLIGEVIGFTPKKIRVKYHRSIDGFDFRKDQLKHPYQVFKYEELVRCKDCKHRGSNMCPMEPAEIYPWLKTKDDAFCSYGERKDNEC